MVVRIARLLAVVVSLQHYAAPLLLNIGDKKSIQLYWCTKEIKRIACTPDTLNMYPYNSSISSTLELYPL